MALRFSANLSMLYTEVPFLDRFEKAVQAGFSAVEFHFPYEVGVQKIKSRLEDLGLTLSSLICLRATRRVENGAPLATHITWITLNLVLQWLWRQQNY